MKPKNKRDEAAALSSIEQMLSQVQGNVDSSIPPDAKDYKYFPMPGKMTISLGVVVANDFTLDQAVANHALTFAKNRKASVAVYKYRTNECAFIEDVIDEYK